MSLKDLFRKKTVEKKRCSGCGKEYPGSLRCEVSQVKINGKACERIKYGSVREGFGPALSNCVCCGVMPGSFHHWECSLEICPSCENRIIVCECQKEI